MVSNKMKKNQEEDRIQKQKLAKTLLIRALFNSEYGVSFGMMKMLWN